MTTTQHVAMYQPPVGCACWHTIADAAEATGASEAAIRRAIKRHCNVGRINGPTVAGMIELSANGRHGFIPYSEGR